jgi:autotransporter-associated beta strand protein
VNEGALVLFKSTGVNATGAGLVTVGDGVGGSRADQLIVRSSNQINDIADVTVSASGLLDLNTFNTSDQINSLSGSGAVDLGPNSVLTVAGAVNGTFSGSIKGGGGLTKSGPNTQELSGDVDYFGPTTVTEGTLTVKGSIGAATTSFGSTLSPGAGPGLLNVRGNFDLQTGGTLKMELGGPIPGTGYDRVVVSGGVTLAGALQGSLINGFQGSGDLFFLLINDGTDAITGTFTGLSEGSLVNLSGKNFFITYAANFENPAGPSLTGGNDVALVIPEPVTGVTLLVGFGGMLGLPRFRRRK